MSRRGRRQPTISLFAFQDIITSVTGILVVVTLLLALDLMQRRPATGAADAPDAAALQSELAQCNQRIEQVQRELERQDRIVRVATMSPLAQIQQRAIRRREIVALQAEVHDATARLDRIEQRTQQFQRQNDDMQSQLNELRGEIEERGTRLRHEKQGNRLYFEFARGIRKRGWVIELGAGGIAAAPIGRAAAPRIFEGSELAQCRDLIDWLRKVSPESPYCFCIVRPAGISKFEAFRSTLESAGIEYGFDLVGAPQTVLDPQTGAAP